MVRDVVVLVHGLWMNGLELSTLGHRLRHEHGYEVRRFSYPTLRGAAADVCRELAAFGAGAAGEGRVHFVGHSLGGVLVYRMLMECGAERFDGNAVLLGAPLGGCKAARGAARFAALRPLLGPLVLDELAESPARAWNGGNAVGAIAGTLRLGTGQFFAHFDEDNDGTIAVSETRIPGLADHLVLPHSHIGMLFSTAVARQVAGFLGSGRFLRDSESAGRPADTDRRRSAAANRPAEHQQAAGRDPAADDPDGNARPARPQTDDHCGNEDDQHEDRSRDS
jgi:pimeloyl-ACP methyl ester carboxylesterase